MYKPHRPQGHRPTHSKASWEYDLCNVSVGIWRTRRSLKKLLILFNSKLLVLLVARTEEDVNKRAESRWGRAIQAANQLVDKRNPFSLAAELPEAPTVVALELRWADIQGMDYTYPLHMDGRLVLEARTLTKRVFPSMRSAHQYYQEVARKAAQGSAAEASKPRPAPELHVEVPAGQLTADEAEHGSLPGTPQAQHAGGSATRVKRTHRRVSLHQVKHDPQEVPPGVLSLNRLCCEQSGMASSQPGTPGIATPQWQSGAGTEPAATQGGPQDAPCILLTPPTVQDSHLDAGITPAPLPAVDMHDSCSSAHPPRDTSTWNTWLRSLLGTRASHQGTAPSEGTHSAQQGVSGDHPGSLSELTSLQPSMYSLHQLTDGGSRVTTTGLSDAGTVSTLSAVPTGLFSPDSRMSLEAVSGLGLHHHHKHFHRPNSGVVLDSPSPVTVMASPRAQALSMRKSASAQDLPCSAVHGMLSPCGQACAVQGFTASNANNPKKRSSLDDSAITLAARVRQRDARVSDLMPSLLQVKARLLGHADTAGSGGSSPRGRHISWGLGWRSRPARSRVEERGRGAGRLTGGGAAGGQIVTPGTVCAQYVCHTVILSFKDPLLPPMLSRFVKSDVRILKLYESGLPAWAVILPSYGLWYRPWLRQATWLLFTAVSCVSMAMGFYDLYKNVPIVRQAMSALSAQIFPPATQLFEWLEKHAQIRLSILLTYLFSKSPLFVTLMRFLRTCMSSMTQLVGPLTAAVQAALAPVVSLMTYIGSSLSYVLQPVLVLLTWLAANLSLIATSLGTGLSALLGPPAQAVWAALLVVGRAGMLLVQLGKTVLWGPLYVCTQAWEALQGVGMQLGANLQWLLAAFGALGRVIAGWGTAAKSAIPAAQATGKAVAAAATAARAAPAPSAASWSLFARVGQEVWGLLEFLRTTLYCCMKSLQAVLNGLMTLATTGYRHKTSFEMQTKQLLLPHQHYLPPAVQQLIQQPSISYASITHEDAALGEVSSKYRETVDTIEPVSPSGLAPTHQLTPETVDAFDTEVFPLPGLHPSGASLRQRHQGGVRYPQAEGLSTSVEFSSARLDGGMLGMERVSWPAPRALQAGHGAQGGVRVNGGSGAGGSGNMSSRGSIDVHSGRVHLRRIVSCPGASLEALQGADDEADPI